MSRKGDIICVILACCATVLNSYLAGRGVTSAIANLSLMAGIVLTLFALVMLLGHLFNWWYKPAYIYHYRGKEFLVQEYRTLIFIKRFIVSYLVEDNNLGRGDVMNFKFKWYIDTDVLDAIIDRCTKDGLELSNFENLVELNHKYHQ